MRIWGVTRAGHSRLVLFPDNIHDGGYLIPAAVGQGVFLNLATWATHLPPAVTCRGRTRALLTKQR